MPDHNLSDKFAVEVDGVTREIWRAKSLKANGSFITTGGIKALSCGSEISIAALNKGRTS